MKYLDALEQELARAVERRARRARLMRAGRSPKAAMLVIAALGLAAVVAWNPSGRRDAEHAGEPELTLAAQRWDPELRDVHGGRLSTTTTPPPLQQRALLGLLRRPQDARDRGRASEAVLRALSPGVDGVRVAYVRAPRTGVVVVPVARLDSAVPRRARPSPSAGGLCVFVVDDAGTDRACGSDSDLASAGVGGYTSAARRRVSWGLVPDLVAFVDARGPHGRRLRVPVVNNVWLAETHFPVRVRRQDWRDASGRPYGAPGLRQLDPAGRGG